MNFLNRAIKSFLLCSCLLPAINLWAQDACYTPLSGDFDFLAVKDISLQTTYVFEYGQIKHWEGEGLHSGVESFGFTLFNCKDIPKNIELPDNPSFICEIKDMEGNLVNRHEMDLTSTFNMLKFVNKLNKNISAGMSVIRGGKYTLTAKITPGMFSYETEIILVDEPNMQVYDNTTTVDTLLCPKVVMTSGYPYNPADFSGKKQLHWQIAAADYPSSVIAEKDEVFELKSETTDLAAVDSLRLSTENPGPGKYIYTLTSDFAPANYSFTAIVNDVLHPEITFDKASYTVGESKEAIVKVDMSYGYPYVGAASSSDKPTVTVCADLLGEETSVSYSDETWADSDMQCTAEIKVPLDKVTAEAVRENNGELPINLSILFNGIIKYETALSLHFESGSSGIHNINADNSDKSNVRYFNILGVEVEESYRGFVITSDGRKINM